MKVIEDILESYSFYEITNDNPMFISNVYKIYRGDFDDGVGLKNFKKSFEIILYTGNIFELSENLANGFKIPIAKNEATIYNIYNALKSVLPPRLLK